ncbi:hypothetical protein L2E82_28517 [Cichorium intybus]|uniref:Uncharacterized protein n=1 Tax=Cichorium intybus TaxID=13427 RepID=A0ACB9CW07_CICIN|nr:hypothetical protein L2E82_28517 [Cichorium intybus]
MAAKKLYDSFSKSLIDEVHRWGAMKQNGVSLRYMMEFSSKFSDRNLLLGAQFLHKELPIRIARRAIELESLPYGLSKKPAILKVRDWYLDSFRDLRSFPDIKDMNDELDFTKMINLIKVRHNNVVPTMALGVQQLKKDLDPKLDYKDLDDIHQFLDRFYMSRIRIRMLIGLHPALYSYWTRDRFLLLPGDTVLRNLQSSHLQIPNHFNVHMEAERKAMQLPMDSNMLPISMFHDKITYKVGTKVICCLEGARIGIQYETSFAELAGPPLIFVSTPASVQRCRSSGVLQPKSVHDSLSILFLDEVFLGKIMKNAKLLIKKSKTDAAEGFLFFYTVT